MDVLTQLSSAKGKRGAAADIALAEHIAKTRDHKAVSQLINGLRHEDSNVQNDCIKTLYELGEREPQLISRYADVFVDLLHSKQNRLVWGSMTALVAIAGRKDQLLWERIDEIVAAFDRGSVITRDEGVKLFAALSAKRESYSQRLFPILLEKIAGDRPKDVAVDVENTLPAVTAAKRDAFIEVVERRKKDLTPSQLRRVERALRRV